MGDVLRMPKESDPLDSGASKALALLIEKAIPENGLEDRDLLVAIAEVFFAAGWKFRHAHGRVTWRS